MNEGYVKGFISGILITLVIAAISVFAYFFFFNNGLKGSDPSTTTGTYDTSKDGDEYTEFLNKQKSIYNIIKDHYYEDVEDSKVYRGAYDGMLSALDDPYTCYYSKEEYEAITETTNGEYVGIGCYVTQPVDSKDIKVVSVIKGSPAEKGGLHSDDIIIAVDGKDVTGLDLDYAVSMVKGLAGTKVVITVRRGTEVLDLEMTRQKIEPETVSGEMIGENVGYIYVASFYGHTPDQFKKALAELEEQGMEKLIVDLRDDPGGLYDSAIKMLDIFLDRGLLAAYLEDNSGKQEKSFTRDPDTFDKPVVILINGNSASASELFTQTMRDYEKATIIGTKSYGKGVYQDLYPVTDDGSAVKITGGRYFSPKGVCIHGVGIEPDITVEYVEPDENKTELELLDDNQIKAAFDYLSK